MGKFKAAGGAAAATIEAEVGYSAYDEAAMGGPPPKGPYLCRVKRLEATRSKKKDDGTGDDPMLKAMVIIEEPAGTVKAKYNGYLMNLYRLATEEQAGSMNQFLQAMAGGPGPKAKALIKAFWTTGAVTEDSDGYGMITKIGALNVDPKDGFLIGVNTRNDNYNGEKRIAPASYIPAGDIKPSKAVEEDEEDEDDSGVEPADEVDADEEIEERREELAELTLAKLKTLAKKAGITVKRGDDEDALIEAIIEVEFPIDEEDDEDEDADAEDAEVSDDARTEREAELEDMSKVALKKAAKEAGGKLADYKALDEEELIEFILDLEFPEADEDEEADEDADEERTEREEELNELPLAKLKPIAKGLGMKLAEYRNMDEEELVSAILSLEFPADEEDAEDAEEAEDEEDEPPAKPAARRGRKTGKSDEPPF